MIMKNRINPRAKWHDYKSSGGYFVTICTKNRGHYFGEIMWNKMILNELGEKTLKYRNDIKKFHPYVVVDKFICMPNHVHWILFILEKQKQTVGTDNICPWNKKNTNKKDRCDLSLTCSIWKISWSLWSIIRGFKTGVTKYANENNIDFSRQPRYHDHIIRNENEYERIKRYIQNNPKNRWKDKFKQ
jgi:REP element-mobilizing transposase RayT